MTRHRLLGSILILHALAHAGMGMWATGRGPIALVTITWLLATAGFFLAGVALLENPEETGRPVRMVAVGATASIVLCAVTGWTAVAITGTVLTLALAYVTLGLALQPPTGHASHSAEPVRSPAPVRRHRVTSVLARMFVAYLALLILARPWHSSWGTTDNDRQAPFPGDDLFPGAAYRLDHAVTIKAPPERVWPWLVQIGQDRAGFYSYDWLERAVGDNVHNADRIVPEWQRLAAGDLVRAAQPTYLGGILGRNIGWRVLHVEPNRALVLRNWGAFVLERVDSATTRLHVRTLGDGRPTLAAIPLAPLGMMIFEPAHFIMQRGMLLGVKRRAERVARANGEP